MADLPHFYIFGRCIVNGHRDCPSEPEGKVEP